MVSGEHCLVPSMYLTRYWATRREHHCLRQVGQLAPGANEFDGKMCGNVNLVDSESADAIG